MGGTSPKQYLFLVQSFLAREPINPYCQHQGYRRVAIYKLHFCKLCILAPDQMKYYKTKTLPEAEEMSAKRQQNISFELEGWVGGFLVTAAPPLFMCDMCGWTVIKTALEMAPVMKMTTYL